VGPRSKNRPRKHLSAREKRWAGFPDQGSQTNETKDGGMARGKNAFRGKTALMLLGKRGSSRHRVSLWGTGSRHWEKGGVGVGGGGGGVGCWFWVVVDLLKVNPIGHGATFPTVYREEGKEKAKK